MGVQKAPPLYRIRISFRIRGDVDSETQNRLALGSVKTGDNVLGWAPLLN
jgi:hypothetical protein